MNSSILNLITDKTYIDFPKDIFPKIICNKKLFGLKIQHKRYAIDSIEKYKLALKNF